MYENKKLYQLFITHSESAGWVHAFPATPAVTITRNSRPVMSESVKHAVQ